MNRYVLTAKSLITNSWLVRIVLLLFAVVSLWMAFMGEAICVVILFTVLLAGTGYTARVYLQSERRRLVPGMNETCAAVSIAFLIVSWIVCSALIVGVHGFSPEAIGGCLCGLAFALWVGCFETAAGPFLFLPYFIPLVAVSFKDTSQKLFEAYKALPQSVHVAAGLLLLALGIAIAARFWFIITSKYSPLTQQHSNNTKGLGTNTKIGLGVIAAIVMLLPGISLLSHFGIQRTPGEWVQVLATSGLHTLIAFAICGLLYVIWRGLIQYFTPAGKSLTDLGDFLFGMSNVNVWKILPGMIAGVFFIAFITTQVFEGSQGDKEIHAKIGFGLLVPPFIVTSFLFYGMPKMFSRLWLTGVSDNRTNTAKVLLLTLLARALPITLLTVATILSISMSTTVGPIPTLIVAILSVMFGSVYLWAIVKLYPFIARHFGFFVLAQLLIAGVLTVSFISNAHELILNVSQMAETVGPWIAATGVVTLATLTTALCVWDASRSMGTSGTMMEVSDAFLVAKPH